MIQECHGNPQCEIAVIRNLLDELQVLRSESVEQETLIQMQTQEINRLQDTLDTYHNLLYNGIIAYGEQQITEVHSEYEAS